jgi:hypothetical protein
MSPKTQPRPAVPRARDPRPAAPAVDDSQSINDRLDEALEETFPASDPIAIEPEPAADK